MHCVGLPVSRSKAAYTKISREKSNILASQALHNTPFRNCRIAWHVILPSCSPVITLKTLPRTFFMLTMRRNDSPIQCIKPTGWSERNCCLLWPFSTRRRLLAHACLVRLAKFTSRTNFGWPLPVFTTLHRPCIAVFVLTVHNTRGRN